MSLAIQAKPIAMNDSDSSKPKPEPEPDSQEQSHVVAETLTVAPPHTNPNSNKLESDRPRHHHPKNDDKKIEKGEGEGEGEGEEEDDEDEENEEEEARNDTKIRVVCISDTHNMHGDLDFTRELSGLWRSPDDVLIHAGDVSERGSIEEFRSVDAWFSRLPYQHIYLVGGNMDGMTLDADYYGRGNCKFDGHEVFEHATYLEHESREIEVHTHMHMHTHKHTRTRKLTIFGSPYTPKFYGGFQIEDKRHARQLWKEVPRDTDILVTHGPPQGILDVTSRNKSVGDPVLRDEIFKRIKPRLCVFGHVHPSNGVMRDEQSGIIFANVAQHDKLKGTRSGMNQSKTRHQIHFFEI